MCALIEVVDATLVCGDPVMPSRPVRSIDTAGRGEASMSRIRSRSDSLLGNQWTGCQLKSIPHPSAGANDQENAHNQESQVPAKASIIWTRWSPLANVVNILRIS